MSELEFHRRRHRRRAAVAMSLALASVTGGWLVLDGAAQAATTRANPTAVCSSAYVVRAGDSWSLIARRQSVTMANLLKANRATTQTVIRPGQRLCVPSVCRNATVRRGDGWTIVARRERAVLANLLKANTASVRTALFPGQVLCVPVAARPTTPTPPTTTPPTTRPPTTTPPTTRPPATQPPTTPGSNLTPVQIIREVWPDALEERAIQIAWRESNWIPTAYNGVCCYGLFQLHWGAHQSWLRTFGVTSTSQLLDARTNARMAYELYRRAGGWGPWGG